jgi:hypothetical protein
VSFTLQACRLYVLECKIVKFLGYIKECDFIYILYVFIYVASSEKQCKIVKFLARGILLFWQECKVALL